MKRITYYYYFLGVIDNIIFMFKCKINSFLRRLVKHSNIVHIIKKKSFPVFYVVTTY